MKRNAGLILVEFVQHCHLSSRWSEVAEGHFVGAVDGALEGQVARDYLRPGELVRGHLDLEGVRAPEEGGGT